MKPNLVCAMRARILEDLGVRDTFPFEERSFFAQAVDALKRDNIDKLRQMLGRHKCSVWIGRGENQAQWQVLQAAVSLVEACEDADRQLPDHAKTQEALIDFYTSSLREVDRLQREFEQAERDLLIKQDGVDEVIPHARAAYRKLVEKAQSVFIRHLEQSGWPPVGRLANSDVFDKLIAPKLQESGRRVAVLLIDALRYELGVELEKQLVDDGQVEMHAAFAQLPSITPVGMASLLPGAGSELKLIRKDDQVRCVPGRPAVTTGDTAHGCAEKAVWGSLCRDVVDRICSRQRQGRWRCRAFCSAQHNHRPAYGIDARDGAAAYP